MWASVLLGLLAGLLRSAPAASLIAAGTATIILIDRMGLWVPGRLPVNPTTEMVLWTLGEALLLVVPAFAVGRLARYGFWRWRQGRG